MPTVTGRLKQDVRFSANGCPIDKKHYKPNEIDCLDIGVVRRTGEMVTVDERFASLVTECTQPPIPAIYNITVGEARKQIGMDTMTVAEARIKMDHELSGTQADEPEYVDKQCDPEKPKRMKKHNRGN